MAIRLYVKNTKPFTEVVVQAKGLKDNITVGVKSYSNSDLDALRKEFQIILDTTKIARWSKQLEDIKVDMSLSDEALDASVLEFTKKIESETNRVATDLQTFYKNQVTHIKNASLSLDKDGIPTDVFVSDTREVKPIESLWETSEECLVVLLNIYSDFIPFRDSLNNAIATTVFNYGFEEGKVKN